MDACLRLGVRRVGPREDGRLELNLPVRVVPNGVTHRPCLRQGMRACVAAPRQAGNLVSFGYWSEMAARTMPSAT
jgi:hypothetical protein